MEISKQQCSNSGSLAYQQNFSLIKKSTLQTQFKWNTPTQHCTYSKSLTKQNEKKKTENLNSQTQFFNQKQNRQLNQQNSIFQSQIQIEPNKQQYDKDNLNRPNNIQDLDFQLEDYHSQLLTTSTYDSSNVTVPFNSDQFLGFTFGRHLNQKTRINQLKNFEINYQTQQIQGLQKSQYIPNQHQDYAKTIYEQSNNSRSNLHKPTESNFQKFIKRNSATLLSLQKNFPQKLGSLRSKSKSPIKKATTSEQQYLLALSDEKLEKKMQINTQDSLQNIYLPKTIESNRINEGNYVKDLSTNENIIQCRFPKLVKDELSPESLKFYSTYAPQVTTPHNQKTLNLFLNKISNHVNDVQQQYFNTDIQDINQKQVQQCSQDLKHFQQKCENNFSHLNQQKLMHSKLIIENDNYEFNELNSSILYSPTIEKKSKKDFQIQSLNQGFEVEYNLLSQNIQTTEKKLDQQPQFKLDIQNSNCSNVNYQSIQHLGSPVYYSIGQNSVCDSNTFLKQLEENSTNQLFSSSRKIEDSPQQNKQNPYLKNLKKSQVSSKEMLRSNVFDYSVKYFPQITTIPFQQQQENFKEFTNNMNEDKSIIQNEENNLFNAQVQSFTKLEYHQHLDQKQISLQENQNYDISNLKQTFLIEELIFEPVINLSIIKMDQSQNQTQLIIPQNILGQNQEQKIGMQILDIFKKDIGIQTSFDNNIKISNELEYSQDLIQKTQPKLNRDLKEKNNKNLFIQYNINQFDTFGSNKQKQLFQLQDSSNNKLSKNNNFNRPKHISMKLIFDQNNNKVKIETENQFIQEQNFNNIYQNVSLPKKNQQSYFQQNENFNLQNLQDIEQALKAQLQFVNTKICKDYQIEKPNQELQPRKDSQVRMKQYFKYISEYPTNINDKDYNESLQMNRRNSEAKQRVKLQQQNLNNKQASRKVRCQNDQNSINLTKNQNKSKTKRISQKLCKNKKRVKESQSPIVSVQQKTNTLRSLLKSNIGQFYEQDFSISYNQLFDMSDNDILDQNCIRENINSNIKQKLYNQLLNQPLLKHNTQQDLAFSKSKYDYKYYLPNFSRIITHRRINQSTSQNNSQKYYSNTNDTVTSTQNLKILSKKQKSLSKDKSQKYYS